MISDGCFTILQKDFFPEGKQGDRDRIILSTDG